MDFFSYRQNTVRQKVELSEKVHPSTRKVDKVEAAVKPFSDGLVLDYWTPTVFDFLKGIEKRSEEAIEVSQMYSFAANTKTKDGRKSILLPKSVRLNPVRGSRPNVPVNERNVKKILKNAKGDLDAIYEIWNLCLIELEKSHKIIRPYDDMELSKTDLRKLTTTFPKLKKELVDLDLLSRKDPLAAAKKMGVKVNTGELEGVSTYNKVVDEFNSGVAWFEVDDYEMWFQMNKPSVGDISDQLQELMVSTLKKKHYDTLMEWYELTQYSFTKFAGESSRNKVYDKEMRALKEAHDMKLIIEKLILPAYEKAKKGRGRR